MRGIYNSNLSASRKKIKKTHTKTKVVSGLYTLGALALMVLVFLTTLNVRFAGDYSLSIATFFRPLINIFKGDFNLVAVVVMLMYLFMVIFTIINFFKCFSKFGRVLRRSYKNVTTCNKNMLLMEEAGDAFSASLVSYVVISFLITMLSYAQKDAAGAVVQMPFTLFGWIALAVGLVIHFVGGTIGGTVSIFIVGASVEEKQREDKIIIFLIRNLIQVVVLVAIWLFFVPATNLYYQLALMMEKSPDCLLTNPSGDMMAFIGLILQPVACVWLVFLMKHALSSTEYNLSGMYGPGMNVFRIFSALTGVTAVGLFVLDLFNGEMIINYLFVAIIAIVGFVLDLIIAPREPREPRAPKQPKVEEESDDLLLENEQPQNPDNSARDNAPQEQKGCPMMQMPCFQGGARASVAPAPQANEGAMPPVPQVDYDEYVLTRNGDLPPRPTEGLPEGMPPVSYPHESIVAPTTWEVNCPNCEKRLRVKSTAKLNRCPVCGKVFAVRFGKAVSQNKEKTPSVTSKKPTTEKSEPKKDKKKYDKAE